MSENPLRAYWPVANPELYRNLRPGKNMQILRYDSDGNGKWVDPPSSPDCCADQGTCAAPENCPCNG